MFRRRLPLIACMLLVAAGSLGLATRSARQDRDLAQRVAALETQVAEQREALAAAQAEIDDLVRIVRAVKSGSDALAEAVRTSREHGFEWAGPNPQSKTELLDGLLKFSRAVQNAVSPPAEPGNETEK